MLTIDARSTINPYGVPVQAVRLALCDRHQWLTLHGDCDHADSEPRYMFGVIGTDYGHLHNTSGGWRLWSSASSAYAAAREYRNNNNN
jgi:LPS sulfotransferase NodH